MLAVIPLFLESSLPEDVQDPGVYAVTVTNPAPVDCESSETVEIELLPTPSVTTLLTVLLLVSVVAVANLQPFTMVANLAV